MAPGHARAAQLQRVGLRPTAGGGRQEMGGTDVDAAVWGDLQTGVYGM